MSDRYTYGDTDEAADRLDLVAQVFEPSTRDFLQRCASPQPELALDLGCGPGNTTRLIAHTLQPELTVGLDRSDPFLDRAAEGAPAHVRFQPHDVRVVPLPEAPADLVYCRLLLSHLAEPEVVVARWATQLRPGGLLLLDELEHVGTDDPVMSRYLTEVALPVVAAQGGDLLVGPRLHAMPDPQGTARVADDVVTFSPPAAQSAQIFAMNLGVLIDRGEVDARPDLSQGLLAVAERPDTSPAVWRLRQLAFRRTDPSKA